MYTHSLSFSFPLSVSFDIFLLFLEIILYHASQEQSTRVNRGMELWHGGQAIPPIRQRKV